MTNPESDNAPVATSSAAGENPPIESRSEQECFARAWVTALNELMTLHLPPSAGFHYRYGNTNDTVSSAIESAVESNFDRICLHFGGPEEDGPTNIVAIVHGKGGVTAFENCEVWAFNTRRRAELIASGRRFWLEERCRLRGRTSNLDEMRARRVALTWNRLRERAFEIAGRDLPTLPKRQRPRARSSETDDAPGGQTGG